MRILLIRTSALGDIVHCLPALRTIRHQLPDAHIGWVVEEVFLPLLARDPDLDEVIPVGLRPWRKRAFSPRTWRQAFAAVRSLRRFRADAVLDLMGNHKAGVLAALSGCRRRIGLERKDRREPSSAIWLSETVPATGRHAVDRALAVVSGLGLQPEFRGFGARELAAAGSWTDAPSEPYVVIHPGAAWPNKCYPADKWAEVATALTDRTGWRVLLSIGPGEEDLATEIEARSGGAARRSGAAGLEQLVGLLAGARLVLGGDTGPTHLAHALGVPSLFLHGPTDPATHGPYGSPERAIWHQLPCSFCHRKFTDKQLCLIDLPVADVVERALGVLPSR